MIWNTALAIFLFGVLVFIHELGHFTVAKLSNVFVERFALGFGPVIFRKRYGETEYVICALPLGGYVKMRGEDPGEETTTPDPRAFSQKGVWTRIAIVAMGPISNLILPIVVFSLLYVVGMPTPTTRIGQVLSGYPAEAAGIRPGDRIVAIEHTPIWKWTDLTEKLRERANQSTLLTVERDGKTLDVTLTPVGEPEPNLYGESHLVGKIGVDFQPFRPVIGIGNPESPAAKAGAKTGDVITAVNGNPVRYWWQISEAASSQKSSWKITLEDSTNKDAPARTIELPASVASLQASGIENGELFLREVKPDSVADEKGLKAGDKLATLNGKPLDSWLAFHRQIRENQGEAMSVGIVRNGKELTVDLIPAEITQKNELTKANEKVRQLGVVSTAVPDQPDMVKERYRNPFMALYKGAAETWEISVSTLVGLGKLVTGRLGLNTLGGPISIFYLAGTSYEVGGFLAFFRTMALLSITLAVLNFLPIPVLDGGHLFFFLIEAFKGSPVSTRIREMAQHVGLVLILGLMVLVFYVDIDRYFLDRIRALFN